MSALSETCMQKKAPGETKRTVLCQYLRGQGASLSPRIAPSTQKPRGSSFQNQGVAASLSDNPVWPRLPMEQSQGWREGRQSSLSAHWEMLHQTLHIPSILPTPGCLGIRGAWRKEDVWPHTWRFWFRLRFADHTASSNAPHCSVCAWNMSLSLSQISTGHTWSSHPVPSGRGSELPWSELAFGGPRFVFCIIPNSKNICEKPEIIFLWGKILQITFSTWKL